MAGQKLLEINELTIHDMNVYTGSKAFCKAGNMIFFYLFFKGYLSYKMITSQNLSSEAQVKIFLFCRKVMFPSQDIQVFVFLTSP